MAGGRGHRTSETRKEKVKPGPGLQPKIGRRRLGTPCPGVARRRPRGARSNHSISNQLFEFCAFFFLFVKGVDQKLKDFFIVILLFLKEASFRLFVGFHLFIMFCIPRSALSFSLFFFFSVFVCKICYSKLGFLGSKSRIAFTFN